MEMKIYKLSAFLFVYKIINTSLKQITRTFYELKFSVLFTLVNIFHFLDGVICWFLGGTIEIYLLLWEIREGGLPCRVF